MAAFEEWLTRSGWSVAREVDFCDLVARRDGHTMFVEAKGRTSAPGLDVDTLYGQLLRRMPIGESGDQRFAVVVPEGAAARAALRVPPRVRSILAIDVFAVSEAGGVSRLA